MVNALRNKKRLPAVKNEEGGFDVREFSYGPSKGKLLVSPVPRKRPRPTDPGVLDRICAKLIAGESLERMCREDMTLPLAREVYYEVAMDETGDFAMQYRRAREAQQDAIVDSTLDLAEGANEVNYNALGLQIKTRQWYASRVAPKKYGDKVDHNHSGGVTVLQINITPSELKTIDHEFDDEL